jgi:cytochrome c oxidase subunit 2
MLQYLGLPVAASAHAGEIDQMMVLVHWLMAVLFAGWGGVFLYMLVRFRRGANPKASYTGTHGKFSKSVEIAVVVAEAVLLIGYAIPAWAKRVRQFPAENEASVVRVVGKQFEWLVHYAGADGKFGRTDVKLVSADNPLGLDKTDPDGKDDITDINNIHVVVDRPVLVHLMSMDVIHSFGLYEMRVKQDAIPGLSIPIWFIPTVTTSDMRQKLGKATFDYEIACSQLCGLGHFRMRGYVTVETPAEHQKWMAEQVQALKTGD